MRTGGCAILGLDGARADFDACSSYKGSRLKPLQAFCLVARLGSVSRAAETLFLSEPAVSLQLKALEQHYGVALLERDGQALWQPVEFWFAAIDRSRRMADSRKRLRALLLRYSELDRACKANRIWPPAAFVR